MLGIGWKRGGRWTHIGLYCDKHIGKVAKVYGTVKVETLSKEDIASDVRCDINDCNGYVDFSVERLER